MQRKSHHKNYTKSLYMSGLWLYTCFLWGPNIHPLNIFQYLLFKYCIILLHCQFIKNIYDNSFWTQPSSVITHGVGWGRVWGMMMATCDTTNKQMNCKHYLIVREGCKEFKMYRKERCITFFSFHICIVTNVSAPICFCVCSFCFWGEVSNSWILNDIGRNSLLGNRKKIAKFLMRTFTCRSAFLYDVFYLGWPIPPQYMYEPKGGGGGLRGLSQRVQLCTWSPNKLRRSNTMFNLWIYTFLLLNLDFVKATARNKDDLGCKITSYAVFATGCELENFSLVQMTGSIVLISCA